MAMATHNTLRHGASIGFMTAIAAETRKISLIGILFAAIANHRRVCEAANVAWVSRFC